MAFKRLGFADTKGRGDFEYLARFSVDHGFKLVQISLDNSRYFPERFGAEERARVRSRFQGLGVGLCFHGPSDVPLMNRHARIRQAGLERICEMIDLALDMGGEYFIFHPGRLAFYSASTQKVFFMEQRYPLKISEIFEDSLRHLLAHCAGRIALCVENTHAVAAPFLDVINKLASTSGLGLVWDVAHTEHLSEARRLRMLKFFQDNIRYVKLAHLHDIKSGAVHKGLGTGSLNIAGYLEIFKTLSIDIILEIFPEEELLNSLTYLKRLQPADSA
jgi:sugar phosphate isomerase/epimerase